MFLKVTKANGDVVRINSSYLVSYGELPERAPDDLRRTWLRLDEPQSTDDSGRVKRWDALHVQELTTLFDKYFQAETVKEAAR